ncbi:uncharacterized protein LOC110025919 isoform X2 [Phalaenopsis equestris]|uniref:uncharacterized protein LOC110025919 isoform X2 n=1 Tax=Phalaenopsis equestris TaxID=78828 RepID=UPI0009E397DC|nr:uncharacterized protein LOC110025919 isoform X2 [Phalaenopsis equestris]
MNALLGAGCCTLPFFFQTADFTSFRSNFLINPNRLRPRCKVRKKDSAGIGSDASEARISDEVEQEDWVSSPSASPYQILGIDPACCSPARLKAAFRARVKEFHPDVYKGASNSDEIILRVIGAYEMLSKHFQFESVERLSSDPFEDPESEACDIFVNELLCVGKGCPYSCVKRAPYAFSFNFENGTARVISQGHVDDYQVQLAVGQCPRRCIHYVTPSQRAILQDVLQRVLNSPWDVGEAAFLESLISKAIFENRRYQNLKRKPTIETEYVDWS